MIKLTMTNEGQEETKLRASVAGVCRACGQKVLEQIIRAKEAILAESTKTMTTQRHIVQLALNEAEAQAWQTQYPHLVFPVLAAEKVAAVATWDARQRGVLQASPTLAWAA